MSIRDSRGGTPDPPKLVVWDNGNSWPDPAESPDVIGVLASTMQERQLAAGLLWFMAQKWDMFQDFVSQSEIQAMLTIADRIYHMLPIVFDSSTDGGVSGDGEFHVTITQTTTPGEYTVTITHPNLSGVEAIFGSPTVTEVAYTASPSVSLTGTGTSGDPYVLHFSIPQGNPGATGATGATGSTGATGAQGPQPVFGSPVVSVLDYDATPTTTITGSGTGGDPYILHLGLPVSPQFGAPTASGLSAGASPTASLSGLGTAASPFILALGIPAGAAGATGAQGPQAQFNTPDVNEGSTPAVAISGSGSSGSPYHLAFTLPFFSIVKSVPPPTPSLTPCDVASAIATYVDTQFNKLLTAFDDDSSTSTETAVQIALDIFGQVSGLTSITSDLVSLIGGVKSNTTATIRSELTTDVPTILKESLYCILNAVPTTVYTPDIAVLWAEAVNSDITSGAALAEALLSFIKSLDPGVLQIIGGIATAGSGSCTGDLCAWHAHIDFTASNGGFVNTNPSSGVWTSGSGWVGNDWVNSGVNFSGPAIKLALDSCTITRTVFAGVHTSSGAYGNGTDNWRYIQLSSGDYNAIFAAHIPTGAYSFDSEFTTADHTALTTDETGITEIYIAELTASENHGGAATITEIDIYGVGTAPSQLTAYLV